MTVPNQLSVVLPPEMAALYRAASPSSDLLAEVVSAPPADARVLLLGGAADPLALLMAQRVPRGACVVAEDDAAAGQRLSELAAKARITNLRVIDPAALSASSPRGELAQFDLALTNAMLHSSKHMTLHLLRLASHLLRPGASIHACGAKDRGIISISDEMRRLFGNLSVPLMRKGHRVVASVFEAALATDDPIWPDPSAATAEPVTLRGDEYLLVPSALVFAGGRLDPAAAMLATAMSVEPGDTVVDLGCGSGIVGLVAARLAQRGHVYLLDASYAAVRTATTNAERNAITNVTALAGDGLRLMAEADLHPNVIVTNPPFHQGQVDAKRLARQFIAASAERLVPDGRLYLVANRFLTYEPAARAYFADVREVAGDASFKVLLAREPRGTPAT